MMQGFGVNTFTLINAEGKRTFVKFHFIPELGVHSLVWDEALKIGGQDPGLEVLRSYCSNKLIISQIFTARTWQKPFRQEHIPNGLWAFRLLKRRTNIILILIFLMPQRSGHRILFPFTLLGNLYSTVSSMNFSPRSSRLHFALAMLCLVLVSVMTHCYKVETFPTLIHK